MSQPTQASIETDVAKILSNFEGREYSDAIGPETRFFADLGLASIDAVVLGEKLQDHYGRPLPFGDLMAELGQRTDRDLRIGELIDFLSKHLAGGNDSASNSQNA
ncbi:acyl carrier protein [Singulisphaera sp. GP187]|uniref:acyl carrier protein n=1 Tax=Singulisphaera sp. GP187 TaxID=1882752 RepID=UPI00092C45C1|nr:acyl carrier protein [Singulisphaera sp. GP187]SIN90033.1 acyl carrier protein [Singulisphaera sp. GP187]